MNPKIHAETFNKVPPTCPSVDLAAKQFREILSTVDISESDREKLTLAFNHFYEIETEARSSLRNAWIEHATEIDLNWSHLF